MSCGRSMPTINGGLCHSESRTTLAFTFCQIILDEFGFARFLRSCDRHRVYHG